MRTYLGFSRALYQVGGTIGPKEARKLQIQLRERLQKVWDATEPKPMPMVFADFQQNVIEQFLDRLHKKDVLNTIPTIERVRASVFYNIGFVNADSWSLVSQCWLPISEQNLSTAV